MALGVAAATLGLANAQESPSHHLSEHALNAGGRPAHGNVASSVSHRVTLDALGTAVAHVAFESASHALEGGFVPPYGPPGEVVGLLFEDDDTLAWNAHRFAVSYGVYRDDLAVLGMGAVGSCAHDELATTTVDDADVPAPSEGFLYLISANNRLAEEGTLGEASDGTTRAPAGACP